MTLLKGPCNSVKDCVVVRYAYSASPYSGVARFPILEEPSPPHEFPTEHGPCWASLITPSRMNEALTYCHKEPTSWQLSSMCLATPKMASVSFAFPLSPPKTSGHKKGRLAQSERMSLEPYRLNRSNRTRPYRQHVGKGKRRSLAEA